jgi:repressor of nif and glnA expression
MNRVEQVRKEILFQVYGVRPLTLDAARIERDARKQGYDFSAPEIRRELVFLADEGLLIRVVEPGTTSERYRIHANGVRHYEQFMAS